MAQYDVAIIGGGLVGCASAYYLSKAGAKVIIIERGQISGQASGQNAGSLHFQLEHRLIEHSDALTQQFALTIPLNLRAIEAWRGLETELQSDLEVVLHGGLMLAESQNDIVKLEKKFALEQQWQLPTTLLDRSQTLAEAPYLTQNLLAAAYCAYEGHANPRLVTPAYARRARILGADIVTNAAVVEIMSHSQGWQIDIVQHPNPRHKITTRKILNAAGAWTADIASLLNLYLPIYAVPLTMSVTESTVPRIHHLLQHASRRLSLKQVRDGNVLIGGGWPSRFRKLNGAIDTNRQPEQVLDNMLKNMAVAIDIVPSLQSLSVIRSWTGIVGVTADQLPLLGHMSRAPGCYVAAGGSAFTLGPVYAQIITDLILERAVDLDISLYSPDRFDHINNFMGLR